MLTPPLHAGSRILAVVTHYRREHWLRQCIESLVTQTRPPDNIVVVDDASPEPPLGIVREFPGVTLMVAANNVGPYALTQELIDRTGYDGYLLQDSDDWSLPERLELLLAEAERTRAVMAGTQMRLVWSEERPQERTDPTFPLAVNAAYRREPASHFLTWATALCARRAFTRIGGLASGLRFAADGEWLRRLTHVGRLVNIPQRCYMRRMHLNQLTSAPDTGLNSPARLTLMEQLHQRARDNAEAVSREQAPLLTPFAIGGRVELRTLCGPTLLPNSSDDSPAFPLGDLSERLRQLVVNHTPPGATVAVVNKGNERLLQWPERRGWHFPRADDGEYLGHHPGTSDDAILQLERARFDGAQFLLVPHQCWWWLDHYERFEAHLQRHYVEMVYEPCTGALYDLREHRL